MPKKTSARAGLLALCLIPALHPAPSRGGGGGSTDPSSWTYRGPEPFSEDETRAKRDLAARERFAAAVSFHSYGELIYYQWSWPDTDETAPDNAALARIASDMAAKIRQLVGNGTYSLERQGAYNQSSPWIYSTLGTFEFLVEVGNSLGEVTLVMRPIWAPSSASSPGP